jgi:hypothetical protein
VTRCLRKDPARRCSDASRHRGAPPVERLPRAILHGRSRDRVPVDALARPPDEPESGFVNLAATALEVLVDRTSSPGNHCLTGWSSRNADGCCRRSPATAPPIPAGRLGVLQSTATGRSPEDQSPSAGAGRGFTAPHFLMAQVRVPLRPPAAAARTRARARDAGGHRAKRSRWRCPRTAYLSSTLSAG